MREGFLQPVTAAQRDFRDRRFKFLGIFVCARTHNCQLCSADHR